MNGLFNYLVKQLSGDAHCRVQREFAIHYQYGYFEIFARHRSPTIQYIAEHNAHVRCQSQPLHVELYLCYAAMAQHYYIKACLNRKRLELFTFHIGYQVTVFFDEVYI